MSRSGLISLAVNAFQAPPAPSGIYRDEQLYLFQAVTGASIPARTAGGAALNRDTLGPTARWVDAGLEWRWRNMSGGDWIDRNGTLQGTVPWSSILTNAVSGLTAVASYSMDLTLLAQRVRTDDRHMAIYVDCPGAQRSITGRFGDSPPSITYNYTDGSTETLTAWVVARSTTSTLVPVTTWTEMPLPVFIEFRRPLADIASCTMNFRITVHSSGNSTTRVFLIDPPPNNDLVQLGIADSEALDAGLPNHSSVIGCHRYMDGTQLSDFVYSGPANVGNFDSENVYDPAIYGTGPQDLNKLPHVGLGKWIGAPGPTNSEGRWSLVSSSYTGDGFEPLAPGLGAIRMWMLPGKDLALGTPIVDGSYVGYTGTTAATARIFMPPADFGLLRRIFTRAYVRIGTIDGGPYVTNINDRKHVYKGSNQTAPAWTERAGKFFITPDHKSSWGGNSASAGGPMGWQSRLGWAETDQGLGGPSEGGWAMQEHLYDFQSNNAPGHNYGGESPHNHSLGQRGGIGSLWYAHNWYCVEHELLLNSVDQPYILSNGSPWIMNGQIQHCVPDGELRTWVNGRLVYERKNMIFRSMPIYDPIALGHAFNPALQVRPIRELGVRSLWNNWFHGGLTRNTVDRVVFFTGLAWARSYIGPMRMPA